MKRLIAVAGGSLVALGSLGAGSAAAASLTISANPTTNSGTPIGLTISGAADRNGAYDILAQLSSVPCGATHEQEVTGNGGGSFGTSIFGRQNLAAGEIFSDPTTFTPAAGVSYRLCGYLGDFNLNGGSPPDGFAQLLICRTGTQVVNGNCAVPNPNPNPNPGPVIEVTNTRGDCADFRNFSAINATHVDCSDAQLIERKWAQTGSCKPSKSRPKRTCNVLGFSCEGKSISKKGAKVRCGAPRQKVRFSYKA